jgi:hypothetical protein
MPISACANLTLLNQIPNQIMNQTSQYKGPCSD